MTTRKELNKEVAVKKRAAKKTKKESNKLALNENGKVEITLPFAGVKKADGKIVMPEAINKKRSSKTDPVKITKKTDPGYCIVMTSPNKPRKFVVVGTFEEAKLIMANAREKDPFVDFMVFEKISLLDNGNGNILKGMAKAA